MSISRVYKIVNDVDDLVYIGSTKQILCKRMANHRHEATSGKTGERKLHHHMRYIGFENFRILLVREYKDISKDRLKYKEDKYIKRFDTVRNGLNSYYAFGHKCEHNIKRWACIECKGSGTCQHNKQKSRCRECDGSAFCEHNKQKIRCHECGGSQVCVHGNRKERCKECGGNEICPHRKNKASCKICSPVECDICFKIFGKANLKPHKMKKHHSSS